MAGRRTRAEKRHEIEKADLETLRRVARFLGWYLPEKPDRAALAERLANALIR